MGTLDQIPGCGNFHTYLLKPNADYAAMNQFPHEWRNIWAQIRDMGMSLCKLEQRAMNLALNYTGAASHLIQVPHWNQGYYVYILAPSPYLCCSWPV